MKHGLAFAVIGACAVCWWPAVSYAQSLNDLTGALGGGKGGGLSALGGGLPDLGQASTGNLAGVLQYCIKHKYLGGGDASAGSSVLGKLTGSGKAKDDGAFKAGSGGLLETGGGDTFSLGGSGIQEKVTDQVCDLVLKHAQSLL